MSKVLALLGVQKDEVFTFEPHGDIEYKVDKDGCLWARDKDGVWWREAGASVLADMIDNPKHVERKHLEIRDYLKGLLNQGFDAIAKNSNNEILVKIANPPSWAYNLGTCEIARIDQLLKRYP